MTVSAISNTALLDPSQTVDASSWQTRMQQALGPVAQLFGESAQQLTSDLQSGKTSLSALAQSKGISQTDLLNAIKQGLQQSSANGGPQLSDTQLTNLASTIANRVHGHHHHHGGGMSGVSSTSTSGISGVGGVSNGDNNGSGGSAGATSASASTSSLQTDVERLMFDLQTMLPSNSTGATSPSTTSANSTSAWSSTSSANLLSQLSQFDQTL
ncbi:MAG TPA: hypothetical protein VL119_13360 [Acidimicrobiia bacterium]|nr:hypothetical protein [Acidimicrobiia bacterium]